MPLHVHSHARVERLAQALADDLAAAWPDPFALVPVVVGSRGMERWLRHQLATAHGIAANLAFPFPRQAIDGLALHLLGHGSGPQWWQPAQTAASWQAERLTFQVLEALDARADQPEFAAATTYLALGGQAAEGVSARKWTFARQTADVLDKLMHDRYREALRWARDPDGAADHAWLALLLRDVGVLDDPSPARVRERLQRLPPANTPDDLPVLRLFCLSTLGASDRDVLEALARHVHLVLYALAPSHHWWADLRNQREAARALALATDAAERTRILDEIGSQNALLAQLGAPSRDLQAWVYAQECHEGTTPAADPQQPTSALGWLQQWVDSAGTMALRMPTALVGDGSLRVLPCWGALRQVEVLRDHLLGLFQQPGADLGPRDVLVMTPNVEQFAPLVAAVFARTGQGRAADGSSVSLPAIPVHIADLGLRRTNPVAEALLAALALCAGRVSAPQLVDLLGLEAVQTRLGLTSDDVADLRNLVEESGMRWAFDAADRLAADQPALDNNTLDFGLERLACGVLMAPLPPGDVARIGERDVVPWPVESPERARRVAALARVLRCLRAARLRQSEQTTGRSVSQWRAECATLIGELTATSAAAGWLSAEVHAALDGFQTEAGQWQGQLTLGALTRALADRFDITVRGDRPITGAVTVCALQPMRSVPFRVIALLGMDDGAFPVAGTPRAWDPFAHPRPGELDGRVVQRHLLLETLLAAREQLWLFYTGHGDRPEDQRPAAVPVEELVDTLAHLAGSDREAWLTSTSLQPWDPAAFTERTAPFDQGLADAANRLTAAVQSEHPLAPLGLAATIAANCPPEEVPPASVGLADLADGLAAPQRLFLSQRLAITLPRDREPLPDREPLELDSLDTWRVRDLLLGDQGLQAGEPVAAVASRVTRLLAAEGQLPLAAGGSVLVAEQVETVADALRVMARCQGQVVDPPLVAVDLVPTVDGRVHQLRTQGSAAEVRQWQDQLLLQWLVPNANPTARQNLLAWLHVVAARAMGLPVAGARVLGLNRKTWNTTQLGGLVVSCELDRNAAHGLLEDAASVWLGARQRPLPLFADTSEVLARSIAAGEPADRCRAKVFDAWYGNGFSPGESTNREIAAFFAQFDAPSHIDDPTPDGLRNLAERVWLPLVQAREQGKAIARQWHRGDGGQP